MKFPDRVRQSRLSAALASVDDLVGEIEGLVTGAEPDADLHRLLNVMEELSERLMDLGYLLLGCEAMRRLEVVFDALSAMISQTRQALDGLDERASS